MNIGIFTNSYKPIISGVVNSIVLIRQGLKQLGHEVFIFAPGFAGYQDNEENIYRFSSLNLTNKIKYPIAIPYSYKIFKKIKDINLDIIHCHHPFILGEVGAGVAKNKNIPLVFTFHTQYEQYSHYIPFPQNFVKSVTRRSVKNYAAKCDKIICPSETILSLLDEYGIKTDVEMLANAIDLEQFKDPDAKSVREKYGIAQDEKLLVYVGRMGVEKNLEFLIQAFKKANEEVPGSKLMIVGEGSQLGPLKALSKKLGIGDKVIFPGRVEYTQIPNYYGAGYAFVMTSTTEVKPLALLEAMASGLPVVAVSAAGSYDTINHEKDGILTNLNMQEYTEALIRILKDDELQKRLSNGAYENSEKYSMASTAKKIEDLYSRAIKEHMIKNKKKVD